MIGETVSHYRITDRIGKGGMGVIYKAEDTKLDRQVALKFLPPDMLRDEEARKRFIREAKAASALDHPNICTIFEIDETEDGQVFIAMALYEGETLRQKIDRGPLGFDEVIDIAAQVARGLARAHKARIIHRDIKPANVMVTSEGLVKILDFGLAKLTDQAQITLAGPAMGTVTYMSPEQAGGDEVDHRTDIWSLGVLLYEMLAGKLPFKGENNISTVRAILDDQPTGLQEIRKDTPHFLRQIVETALQKDPDARYGDVNELIGELGAGDSEPDHKDAVRGPKFIVPLSVALVSVAALVLLVIGLWPGKDPGRKTLAVEQLIHLPSVEMEPAFSPDGKFVAYAGNAEGNFDVYLLRLGGERPINLTADSKDDETEPAFSPDGSEIAFHSSRKGGGLYVMGATGEEVRKISDEGHNPCWSKDGQEIYYGTVAAGRPTYSGRGFIWAFNLKDKTRRRITEKTGDNPSISPNGLRIAYSAVSDAIKTSIWTVGVDGKDPVQVTKYISHDFSPQWSPSGKYLYFLSERSGPSDLWRVAIDEESGAVRGEPEQLTSGASQMFDLAVSSDELMAYTNQMVTHAIKRVQFVPDKETIVGSPVTILESTKVIEHSRSSPDGSLVAFALRTGNPDIALIDVQKKQRRFVTKDVHDDRVPEFSPDGKWIAYASSRNGPRNIWVVRVDGTGARQVTDVDYAGTPIWSPDGKRIAAAVTGGFSVFEMPEGEPHRELQVLPGGPVPGYYFYPFSWSPDGTRLTGGGTDGKSRIYNFQTGKMEPLEDLFNPYWLADSQRLLCVENNLRRLLLFNIESKTIKILLELPDKERFFDHSSSADDSEIFFNTVTSDTQDLWLIRAKQGA